MTHKNVRTFQKLQDLGGDVLQAKRWVLKDPTADIPDDFDEILKKAKPLEKIVEKPTKGSKIKVTDDMKDKIRAAKVALAVAMSVDDQRKLAEPSGGDGWAQLDAARLCALVQRLLPAPVPPSDFSVTFHMGNNAIGAQRQQIVQICTAWRDLAERAAAALDSAVIAEVMPDDDRSNRLSAQVLRNLSMLTKEVDQNTDTLYGETNLAFLHDGTNRLHAVCIFSIEDTDTGTNKTKSPKEKLVTIDSLMAHPGNILNLEGAGHVKRRGVAEKLLAEVEKKCKAELECKLAYLLAGTKDVENYYAMKHGYLVQDQKADGSKRRRANSVTLDAEHTSRLAPDKLSADMAAQVQNKRMVKKL